MKLDPILHSEIFVFAKATDFIKGSIAFFAEQEGVTMVMDKKNAEKHGLNWDFESAWITVNAKTSLTDLGITAKFSEALSKNGISCNVFAPIHHDHIFVPFNQGKKAFDILRNIDI